MDVFREIGVWSVPTPAWAVTLLDAHQDPSPADAVTYGLLADWYGDLRDGAAEDCLRWQARAGARPYRIGQAEKNPGCWCWTSRPFVTPGTPTWFLPAALPMPLFERLPPGALVSAGCWKDYPDRVAAEEALRAAWRHCVADGLDPSAGGE